MRIPVIAAVVLAAAGTAAALSAQSLQPRQPIRPRASLVVEATSADARREAWVRHQQMARESPVADLAWRAVGPRLQPRRSLTWDRGTEMAAHRQFTLATQVQVHFCDPQSPWQRGTNENTNGLLRQYFPPGTDLRAFSQAQLNRIAHRLNTRPRKTLDYDTPADRLAAAVALTA
jgi:IS30 family transposase